ncbi:MAG: hypothetical protein WD342_15920 [Verrucomicrobiales bacterium]
MRKEAFLGSEHVVDFDDSSGLVVKVTKPPGFGFIPQVHRHARVKLYDDAPGPGMRPALELEKATPLEYLRRWIRANEVFGDDVRLASVIRWKGGEVSFCILQPHYDGEAATSGEIERYFAESGWTHLKDPNGEHEIFMNYAFDVIAVDAMPRNCKLNEYGLQPFDVILASPDEDLESFLQIYPG